jgi:D-cysteine desulfhydrase
LEFWEHLSRTLDANIVAKRDDISVIGLGGNKVRKLDLILGGAIRSGITDVITIGGLQSNHCRLTAAACARLGLRSHVLLRGDNPSTPRAGNLLLDELFGASVHICDVDTFDDLALEMDRLATDLRSAGRSPLVIPLGGSTPLGTLAYALAVRELADQVDANSSRLRRVDRIIVAAGTGNTLAGIALGCSVFMPATAVVGVSVSRSAEQLSADLNRYRAEASHLLGARPTLDNVEITDAYVGAGYTIPNHGTTAAVRLLARTEGVVGDLTYTGKALEFLIEHAAPVDEPSNTTLFWHTGGSPELFSRPAHALLGAGPGDTL